MRNHKRNQVQSPLKLFMKFSLTESTTRLVLEYKS